MSEYGNEEYEPKDEEVEEQQEVEKDVNENKEINMEDFHPIDVHDIKIEGQNFEPLNDIESIINEINFEPSNYAEFDNSYKSFEPNYSEIDANECRVILDPKELSFIDAIINDPTLSREEKMEALQEKLDKLWENPDISYEKKAKIASAIDDALTNLKIPDGGILISNPLKDNASEPKDDQNYNDTKINNQERSEPNHNKRKGSDNFNGLKKESNSEDKKKILSETIREEISEHGVNSKHLQKKDTELEQKNTRSSKDFHQKKPRKGNIEEMKELAKIKGGECLSKRYINSETKLKWKCGTCGHEWRATPHSVKNHDTWCPKCANQMKYTIKDMQEIAKSRGGECLSEKYLGVRIPLKWRCGKCNHEWESSPDNVKNKETWCPKCAKSTRGTLKEMKELAKSKGGECLSTEYINAHTKLKWRCGTCNHEWSARPYSIKYQGTWCPKCAGNMKGTIKQMQELAASKPGGGECLSKRYVNSETKLKWKCGICGHEWQATPDNVKNQDSWCPKCGKEGIGEKICRAYFEAIFNKPFKRYRPDWLKSKKGRPMDLDGYNDDLKLAFERQGIQHYEFTPFFHRNEEVFKERLENDKITRTSSNSHNVTLVEVPYYINNEEMGDFIIKQCETKGIKIPEGGKNIGFNDIKVNKENLLKEMQDLAKYKGGECLSTEYINANKHLLWKCGECGHEWYASPNNIKNNLSGKNAERGTWCPKCAGKLKGTIEEMQELAKSRGGECLSTEYKNAHTYLLWKCGDCGYEWRSIPYSIKNKGSWCPKCSNRKLSIEEMQELAKLKRGKCLSLEYINAYTKLKWRCGVCDHEWWATPNSIKSGKSWCPKCAGVNKGAIEEMQELAKSKGGECLSKEYINAHTKLKWRCGNCNYEWRATPNYLKSFNSWCPQCQDKKKNKK